MTTEESFPPPGFAPASSQVAGIEVYAPAGPDSSRLPELVDFKCPRCGATTAYRVEAGGLACDHCGYTEQMEAQSVGRAAEEFEFTVDTIRRSQQGWAENRREMACRRCGGVVSIPADTLAYACPFCASNKVLVREPLEDVLRPRFLLPFKVDPAECKVITQKWLGSSWMTPAELRISAPDRFYPIYIPYWTFTAACDAVWKAMVGHEKVEHYTDERGVRRERRTIDWRPESGKVHKVFDDLLVPGTQRLNLSALGKIDAFSVNDLVRYEPGLLAGMNAQAYDVPLEQAWEIGRQILRERTRQACRDRIASPHVRSFKMSLDFRDEQWRYILAPLYTSVYTYREKTYQVLINGQTGKIAGPRPVDWQKVWLIIAALLSPGIVLGLAGLFMARSEYGDLAGGLGLFLLAVGVVIAFFILHQAQEMSRD